MIGYMSKTNKNYEETLNVKVIAFIATVVFTAIVGLFFTSIDKINTKTIQNEDRSKSNLETNKEIKQDVKDVKKMMIQLLISKKIKPNIGTDEIEIVKPSKNKNYEFTKLSTDKPLCSNNISPLSELLKH